MNQLEKFRDINTFIFDIEGVLTDARLVILNSGEYLRNISIRDEYALRLAIQEKYQICLISETVSEGVQKWLENLGVRHFYLDQKDKLAAYTHFMDIKELHSDTILFMGDDIPDYPIMQKVGLPVCPADASPELFPIAKYISPFPGGQGCVRDVIEKVLKLHGKWPLF